MSSELKIKHYQTRGDVALLNVAMAAAEFMFWAVRCLPLSPHAGTLCHRGAPHIWKAHSSALRCRAARGPAFLGTAALSFGWRMREGGFGAGGDGADVALGLVPCWRTLPCASLAVLVGESPLQCCVRRLSPLQRSVTLTASAERWRGKNQKTARPRFFPLSSAFSTGNTRRLRCLAQLLRRFPAQGFPPWPSVSAERGSVTAQRSPLAFPHRAAPERAAV